MNRVRHTPGSRLLSVEAITPIYALNEVQVYRVLLGYKPKPGAQLQYRAVHFTNRLPRIGCRYYAGPQDVTREIRVGDELVLEGTTSRLTFTEHGNGSNAFHPVEVFEGCLIDPFDRRNS